MVLAPADSNLAALTALFAGLPPDLHTPIVLATEDDPARYAVALNTRTMQRVEERARFVPKHVYCVPLTRPLIIQPDHIVAEDRPVPLEVALDSLMMSAAETFKDRLTVILLDGMALETAPNALAVKNFGATVIAEKPANNHAVELPAHAVDVIAPAADIGQVVQAITQKRVPDENILKRILDRATAQAGVDFHTYRSSTILRRINRRNGCDQNADACGLCPVP